MFGSVCTCSWGQMVKVNQSGTRYPSASLTFCSLQCPSSPSTSLLSLPPSLPPSLSPPLSPPSPAALSTRSHSPFAHTLRLHPPLSTSTFTLTSPLLSSRLLSPLPKDRAPSLLNRRPGFLTQSSAEEEDEEETMEHSHIFPVFPPNGSTWSPGQPPSEVARGCPLGPLPVIYYSRAALSGPTWLGSVHVFHICSSVPHSAHTLLIEMMNLKVCTKGDEQVESEEWGRTARGRGGRGAE
ncbi:unnamed protein product [Pleuronectes platessa]|uniref:Uncharacterized protein n=1 Tax=Pleuronectes platessa TaxID=8262 RepID=A0A9N7YDX6_PLEPL|nr:unnamed protein product [Pleuronectes platessa]